MIPSYSIEINLSKATSLPKTVYPIVEFVKSKYLCLKSGTLYPLPIEELIIILSDNEIPKANLLDSSGE